MTKPIPEQIADAQAEMNRILGFRSLSSADWQTVRKLRNQILELEWAAKRAEPIRLAEKVARFPRVAGVAR